MKPLPIAVMKPSSVSTRRLGGSRLDVSRLWVTPAELEAARAGLPNDVRKAIRSARANVRAFAKRSLRKSWFMKNKQGAVVGERFDPFERVGIYIPGGTAPLVSTAVMTCTLAAAAGVREIVAVTPSAENGSVHPASARRARRMRSHGSLSRGWRPGDRRVWLSGQRRFPPVQKIFGPGNAYVVEAKRQVFGQVAIDLLPGPSEILVIADDSANSEWIAADLLAQSEHGRGSIAILLTDSPRVLDGVAASLERQTWPFRTPAGTRSRPEKCQPCSGRRPCKRRRTRESIFRGTRGNRDEASR